MLAVGIDTGLRISDILRLKVSNFVSTDECYVIEQKTKKKRLVSITRETALLLHDYVRVVNLATDDYLVYSREGQRDKPLSRAQAYKTIARISQEIGLDSIGTHSMRKTYAVNHFREKQDIAALQADFMHRFPSTTLAYLSSKVDANELAKQILNL
jgi:integrase